MTIKIFWENPYLTQLTTTVKTVCKDQITLSESIFYAFSGGQESDSGTISGYPVLSAKKVGLNLYYTLPKNHTIRKNDHVTISIDWSRRYLLMRLHFAAEIILMLMYEKFPHIKKIGAHISQKKARIDFISSVNLSCLLRELQSSAQKIINANKSIISTFSNKQEEKRYWKIKGFPPTACGGTHIKSTCEVGCITLKRVNLGKEKERIEIFVQN